MSQIEIGILRPEEGLRACAEAWHVAEAGAEPFPSLALGNLHELFSAIAESEFDPVVDLDQRQCGVHRFEPDLLAEGLVAAQHPGAVWATRV